MPEERDDLPKPNDAREDAEDIMSEPEEDSESELDRLRAELDDLNSRYLRTLADYQNSQRRHAANEREARQQGVTSVLLNVLTVVDHFDLALSQDPARSTADQIIGGVKVIRDELLKVLQNHGVTTVLAWPNEQFDPRLHEAVMQDAAEGIKPGHVVATLQAGYKLGDRVIRPAKVSVAPGSDGPGTEG